MTVLVVPATVPASAATDASVPALTEVRPLTKRKRRNKASREKRKKRRKLEKARQAAQQAAGGLGVLNAGKPAPVETPGQAEQRGEGSLGVLNTGKPAPVAMSSWLWMSFAPSYSSDGSLPLLMAFDEAGPKGKAVQRCFTVEEVRNEEGHGKGYQKRAWTDFVDRVVAAGQKAYEEAKAAGTVDTYEPPVFHPQGCAPSSRSFPPGDTDVVCPVRNLGNAGCMTDAWLCALPRLQRKYVDMCHRTYHGLKTFDELLGLAGYTDHQARVRLTLKKIRCSHRELVLKKSGVYVVAGQEHAVAVDCARGLIFNPCVEHASTLNAKNLAAQGIPDVKGGIDVAKLVSTAL
eukprot:g79024.t1